MNRLTRLPARCPAAPVGALLWCLLAPAAVPAAGAVPPAPEAAAPAIEWRNYREGKAAARHRERPLLVFFTTAWSSEGARLDREIWTDERVRAYVADNLVAARVDIQEMPAVGAHFGVDEPPAVLLAAPDGRALVILRGFHVADSILRVSTYAASGAWEYADYETWLSRQRNR